MHGVLPTIFSNTSGPNYEYISNAISVHSKPQLYMILLTECTIFSNKYLHVVACNTSLFFGNVGASLEVYRPTLAEPITEIRRTLVSVTRETNYL